MTIPISLAGMLFALSFIAVFLFALFIVFVTKEKK